MMFLSKIGVEQMSGAEANMRCGLSNRRSTAAGSDDSNRRACEKFVTVFTEKRLPLRAFFHVSLHFSQGCPITSTLESECRGPLVLVHIAPTAELRLKTIAPCGREPHTLKNPGTNSRILRSSVKLKPGGPT